MPFVRMDGVMRDYGCNWRALGFVSIAIQTFRRLACRGGPLSGLAVIMCPLYALAVTSWEARRSTRLTRGLSSPEPPPRY